MAIPYFFEPIELDHHETGRSVIIDGGTLSNFPVWLFDINPDVVGRSPTRPTFGFTLTGGRGFGGRLKAAMTLVPWPAKFGFEIFQTASEAWDERFVSQSTRVRTVAVDADDVATTEFRLAAEKQDQLIRNGHTAVREFLETFELEDYMNTFHARLGADEVR
jgi:NTE family protein